MVRTRVILGSSLIAGLLALLWLDSLLARGPAFHAFIGAVLVAGLVEFYGLAAREGSRPLRGLGVALAVVFVAADYAVRVRQGAVLAEWFGSALGGFYAPMALAAALAVLAVAVGHLCCRDTRQWLADAGATVLGLFYVWFLGAHVFAIRGLGVGHVLAFIAAPKLGDAGAYFAGTHWGGRRLAPRVSPNKTVVGAVAGLGASMVSAVGVAWGLGLEGGLGFWAAFGLVVGGVGQAGDLVESALKRSAGVKDSGRLLPQFGGVLDTIDSLLLSAPVAVWLLALR